AYSGLGRLKEMNGQVADADTLLRKAIAVQPGLAEAHLTLATTLIVTNTHEANREFQEAIRVDNSFSQAHSSYADYLLLLGDLNNAVKLYRSVSDVAPASMDGYLRIAEAYREANQNANVRTALQQAAAVTAAHTAQNDIAIGDEYLNLGDNADAILF